MGACSAVLDTRGDKNVLPEDLSCGVVEGNRVSVVCGSKGCVVMVRGQEELSGIRQTIDDRRGKFGANRNSRK